MSVTKLCHNIKGDRANMFKTSHSNYLYQFTKSQNYYFRIRLSSFFSNRKGETQQLGYVNSQDYFVASLRTSVFDDAKWLAIFIKRNLVRELAVMSSMKTDFQNDNRQRDAKDQRVSILCDIQSIDLGTRNNIEAAQYAKFKHKLKERFQFLLEKGKALLDADYDDSFVIPRPIPTEKWGDVQEYLGDLVPQEQQKILVNRLCDDSAVDGILVKQFLNSVAMLNKLSAELQLVRNDFNGRFDSDISGLTTEKEAIEVKAALKVFENIHSLQEEETLLSSKVIKHEDSFNYYFEKFLQAKKRALADGSLAKYKYSASLLDKVFPQGFAPSSFSRKDARAVKSMLSELKSHQSKGNSQKELRSKTLNGFLSNYRTFFTWYIREYENDMTNPFSNMSFEIEKDTSRRRSFCDEEVRDILGYEPRHGNEAKHFRKDAFWFPKIALYSGMRLNEISAIPLAHIKEKDGVWYFDLEGLEVKNASSERTVPIAQYLLDLGLLDYVASLKQNGESLLFPQIRSGKAQPGSGGWGDSISRWFNRTLLKNIGIDSDKELSKRLEVCFHCTRRTLITNCVNNGEQHYLIKRIVGHSVDDDVTLGVYSDLSAIPLAKLKKVLDDNLKWHVKH